jgi:hypothetical protein
MDIVSHESVVEAVPYKSADERRAEGKALCDAASREGHGQSAAGSAAGHSCAPMPARAMPP